MADVRIRPAERADLARLVEIYNYYVIHTPITFDVEPYTLEKRSAWFEQFATSGRHRLLVAESEQGVFGYAGTMRWRPKAAYDTTVETTIYCAHDVARRGCASLRSGIHHAKCGDRRAPRAPGIQAGRSVQRSRAQVWEILGCVLDGEEQLIAASF